MNPPFKDWLCYIILATFPFTLTAQQLSFKKVDLPVSKEAKKKGMYISTTLLDDNSLRTFISYDLKKDEMGFDVISIDANGNVTQNASEVFTPDMESKYNISVPRESAITYPNNTQNALRLVTASGVLGSMKFERGHFEPSYATSVEYGPYLTTYTPVFRGFKFKDDETIKSGTKINVMAVHVPEEQSIERNYKIVQGVFESIGTVGFMSENSTVSFIGNDARFDKDSPYAQNVLVAGKFDGNTREFSNLNQVILDYNCIDAANGYAHNGDRVVVVAPLNAPTSIKEHQKYQAKGEPYMTFISFDLQGNVTQNITFKSASVRGNFGVFGHDGADYLVGSINNGHDGYYRFDVGNPTHFQVVKFKDGAVDKQTTVSYEELESKVVMPDGEKGKFKFKDIKFIGNEVAPNGDLLVIANTGGEYLIFQLGTDAIVNSVYLVPRMPDKEHYSIGYQTLVIDNDIYFLFREQNGEISQGVKRTVSRGAGYMKNTNFSRVDELMAYGRLVKIDAAGSKCSAPVDFTDEVILGETPMFPGNDGKILIPIRDNKKRDYKLAVIN